MKRKPRNLKNWTKWGVAIAVASLLVCSPCQATAQYPDHQGFPAQELPIAEDKVGGEHVPGDQVQHADFQAQVPDDGTAIESEGLGSLLEEPTDPAGLLNGLKAQASDLDLGKMLGSLALVLGGYFALVWLLRKFQPASARGLPAEVFQVMGTMPFGPKQRLHVIRLGSKLMLIVNGPDGTQSIGEINDRQEVQYLADLCRGRKPRRSLRNEPPAPSVELSRSSPDGLRQIIRQLQSTWEGQKQQESVFEA